MLIYDILSINEIEPNISNRFSLVFYICIQKAHLNKTQVFAFDGHFS